MNSYTQNISNSYRIKVIKCLRILIKKYIKTPNNPINSTNLARTIENIIFFSSSNNKEVYDKKIISKIRNLEQTKVIVVDTETNETKLTNYYSKLSELKTKYLHILICQKLKLNHIEENMTISSLAMEINVKKLKAVFKILFSLLFDKGNGFRKLSLFLLLRLEHILKKYLSNTTDNVNNLNFSILNEYSFILKIE